MCQSPTSSAVTQPTACSPLPAPGDSAVLQRGCCSAGRGKQLLGRPAVAALHGRVPVLARFGLCHQLSQGHSVNSGRSSQAPCPPVAPTATLAQGRQPQRLGAAEAQGSGCPPTPHPGLRGGPGPAEPGHGAVRLSGRPQPLSSSGGEGVRKAASPSPTRASLAWSQPWPPRPRSAHAPYGPTPGVDLPARAVRGLPGPAWPQRSLALVARGVGCEAEAWEV